MPGALGRSAPRSPGDRGKCFVSEPRGRGARSPPLLPSGLCTCRGWRAGQASRSACWSGPWKAAPKPGKEKSGLFLYHQGSGSSCAILGEMDGTKVLITQLNPSRGSSLLTRPSSLDAGIRRWSESHFSFGPSGKRYVEHFPLFSHAWVPCL